MTKYLYNFGWKLNIQTNYYLFIFFKLISINKNNCYIVFNLIEILIALINKINSQSRFRYIFIIFSFWKYFVYLKINVFINLYNFILLSSFNNLNEQFYNVYKYNFYNYFNYQNHFIAINSNKEENVSILFSN